VNVDGGSVDRALALTYAPVDARAGMKALFALDATLAQIVRSTREPLVGQMRLTWWHDALLTLGEGPSPAPPVLVDLAGHVLPRVPAIMLASMIDGWEALLDDPLEEPAMETFARCRGGNLFEAAAVLLAVDGARARTAGEGWALADLAGHLRDPLAAARARVLAEPKIAAASCTPWPVRGRVLGALLLSARPGEPGSPPRVGRMLWHRLTGR
jgi:phytoene synthase